MTYPIPTEALDDRLCFIGCPGAGKTYNAGTGVEQILASGGRAIIPDPLGVWWGLALEADGKTPAPWRDDERLVIFGGEHGDLPINEHAGTIIGETAAKMGESAILDLSSFGTKAAEYRFMRDFLTALYKHTPVGAEPVHLIFDEADMWAPQTPRDKGDAIKVLGMMETIIRRGRVRGFTPWLITQRPAVLNKNVLSMVDGLAAFKLTSSQDRDAIGEWVKGTADTEQWKAFRSELPTMNRGQALVWLPGRDICATEQFPEKSTFDSSRTPKRGEKRERRDLKPVNLAALQEKMATVENEAKANDPNALKAEVARLKRELAKAEKQGAPDYPDLREELASAQAAEREAVAAQRALASKINAALEALGSEPVDLELTQPTPVDKKPEKSRPVARPAPQPKPVSSNGEVPQGCQKALAALAGTYPAGMTDAQWATVAGYKRTGGTWGTYKSRLSGVGMIEKVGNEYRATEIGAGAVGNVELPPAPGPELVRWWAAKLPGTTKVAEALLEHWPEWVSRDDLAEWLGMAASGGTFGTYLSRLASPNVIERQGGMVRLTDEVMVTA